MHGTFPPYTQLNSRNAIDEIDLDILNPVVEMVRGMKTHHEGIMRLQDSSTCAMTSARNDFTCQPKNLSATCDSAVIRPPFVLRSPFQR